MPELPEVETIKRQLEVFLPLKIQKTTYSKFSSSIIKQKKFNLEKLRLSTIKRKGKWLDFVLGNNMHMLSNLGMSGSWRIDDKPITAKHAHLKFQCLSKRKKKYLAYVDPRRFGNIYICNQGFVDKKLDSLGPDILNDDLPLNYVEEVFKKNSSKMIKILLLEQKYFAGIGNYMASEICARAKILPTRPAGKTKIREIKAIKKAIKIVIKKSLASQGLSFHGGYFDARGDKGKAINHLLVFYQKICGQCKKEEVSKIILKGRGTYFCKKCQK